MSNRMVRVVIKFMSSARARAGTGRVEIIVPVPKLRAVLSDIVEKYDIRDMILTEDGEIKQWARVLVNGRAQDFMGGLDSDLHDGDTIALIYPYTDNF